MKLVCVCVCVCVCVTLHTLLSGIYPPNSARIGYATDGAFFISAQLPTYTVWTHLKFWVLIRLWNNIASKRTCKHEAPGEKWVPSRFKQF